MPASGFIILRDVAENITEAFYYEGRPDLHSMVTFHHRITTSIIGMAAPGCTYHTRFKFQLMFSQISHFHATRPSIPVIEEANWETLPRDIAAFLPNTKFDAVICLGNSFAHLLDEHGDQRVQNMCLQNFASCLKPGGLLFIDHRNYDSIIESGATPLYNIYYNVSFIYFTLESILQTQYR